MRALISAVLLTIAAQPRSSFAGGDVGPMSVAPNAAGNVTVTNGAHDDPGGEAQGQQLPEWMHGIRPAATPHAVQGSNDLLPIM